MVVGLNVVVDKMYAWMRSEGIWTENAALSERGGLVSDSNNAGMVFLAG